MPYEEVSHVNHALKQLQSVNQEVVAGAVAAVAASTVLTIVNGQNAVADETVVIDGYTYTFKAAAVTNSEVTIGADDDATCVNLAAVVNANPASPVTAVAGTNIVTFTAKEAGTAGNAITTTETMSQGSFTGGTLASGAGNIAVANITKQDAVESVLQVDGTTGVPTADVTSEVSIPTAGGAILLSTTDTSADVLVVRWLKKAVALK
jgi:phage tail sheath gpL-like